jgi:hypothetical protein
MTVAPPALRAATVSLLTTPDRSVMLILGRRCLDEPAGLSRRDKPGGSLNSATEVLMRRILIGFTLLIPVLTLSAAEPDAKDKDKTKAPLRVGGNLPGAFHPYNLTGKYDGRYHCPISEQDLDPTVLLFTRDIEPTPALEQLIVDLGVAARKNRDTRLTIVVVFLPKLD